MDQNEAFEAHAKADTDHVCTINKTIICQPPLRHVDATENERSHQQWKTNPKRVSCLCRVLNRLLLFGATPANFRQYLGGVLGYR